MLNRISPFVVHKPDEPPAGTPGTDPKAEPTPATTAPPEVMSVPKAEWDSVQSALAEMRREAKKNADAVKKAAEDKAREAGEHEKLATQYQAERDDAQAELANERATARVRAAAGRLKFRNPDDAVALLATSAPDLDRADEAAVEHALGQLADDRKYLIDDGAPARTGSPAAGGDGPVATLDEQLKEASAKGDWDEVSRLNARKLANAMSKT